MKRTPLKKVGRVGRANILARKRIAEICEKMNISRCEIQFEGCLGDWTIAPAHRHRRNWYMGSVEKLSDYNEFIIACSMCHQKIDSNSKLLEETFKRLRNG